MNMNANVVIVSGTCCRRADAPSSIFIYQKSTFSFFLSGGIFYLFGRYCCVITGAPILTLFWATTMTHE
jgi:hypothetical protein